MIRAEYLWLSHPELHLEAADGTSRVWRHVSGDAVGIFFFSRPPDLPSGCSTAGEFFGQYRRSLPADGTEVVEAGICEVGGLRCVRLLAKVPQLPDGVTCLSSTIVPFSTLSWVVKAQCEEWGDTGIREATLLDEAMTAGAVHPLGSLKDGWNPDAEKFDHRFPLHPVTRARSMTRIVGEALRHHPEVASLAPFGLPPAGSI